jgi:hypothetical protein
MGRTSDLDTDTTAALHIRRVPLDDGYDPGGTYWGGGEPSLFCVWDDEDHVRYLRAVDLVAARAEFPHAAWAPETGPTEDDISDMLDGYVACSLWSSNDESDDNGGEPFDSNYSIADIAPETLARMREDCARFARENAATLLACMGKGQSGRECDWSLAGHDFWLTRNGDGCGFWDGGWPRKEGELLSDAAHAFGEANLYLGDDGKIYGQ